MKKQRNSCTGESLLNKKNMGGHIEDYITDPNNKPTYPSGMRWVPVSQSFKKD